MIFARLKRHDTLPTVFLQLTELDGSPVVFSPGDTATLIVKTEDMATTKLQELMEIVDADLGYVRYNWQAADTAVAGRFPAEVEVVRATGKQTWPTKGYGYVLIDADLNDA